MSGRAARRPNHEVRRTLLATVAGLLGMLSLNALVSGRGWMIDAALSAVVVIAPAAMLRIRRTPGAFDVWLGVALLVPWLTLRFVPDHALLGVIPTDGTLHDLSRLMTELHRTTSRQHAPVPSSPPVRLVLCALVGLLTALVDLIAVVGRRAGLAGLPLLVVYTVSGAIAREAVGWIWFAGAAAGFLLLLALDASTVRTDWGHLVPQTAGARVTGPRTGLVVGAVAVAIAALLPLITPLPGNNLLANAFRNDSGSGLPQFGAVDSGSINPFAALSAQLRRGKPVTLMTVHMATAWVRRPPPFYLRTNVLDTYTSAGWRVSSHGAGDNITVSDLGAEPGDDHPAASRYTAQITIKGLTSSPPVFTRLLSVQHVSAGTVWSSRDQLMIGDPVPRGTVIDEQFDQAAPTVQDLLDAPATPRSLVTRWLTKPQLPAYVVSLVRRLTAGANGPYAAARAIMRYFTDPANGFQYTLQTAAGDSGNALVDFLHNKQGFCQQYAAAMAIMLRQAGVPSRVVLGYMHPTPDKFGDFTVTSDDAHAWVEAYFAGIGWIPFDPTPAAGLAGGAASDLTWAPHVFPKNSDVVPTRVPSSAAAKSSAVPSTSAASTDAAGVGSGSGGGSVDWSAAVTVLVIVVLVGLLASVPAGVRSARRRRRWAAARRGDAEALWRELTDSARDLGYAWSPARSPRQVAAWLGGDAIAHAGALNELAAVVERQRYGRALPAADRAQVTAQLVRPLRAVIGSLRAHRSGRTRFSASVWPASLGWRLGGGRSAARRH